MKRIGIHRSDGGLSVMTFVDDGAGEADILHEITKWETGNDQGWTCVGWVSLVEADVPPRRYRNAYELGKDGKPACNMAKARNIHLAAIREARQPILNQKDRDWMKAFGRADTVTAAAIEAERQVLRDLPQTLTPTIDAALTPDALAAIWPAELK